jgi:hypothetical protein
MDATVREARGEALAAMSDDLQPREDHLVEPLYDALRDHSPREEPRAVGRGHSWLVVAALVLAAVLLYAWLA